MNMKMILLVIILFLMSVLIFGCTSKPSDEAIKLVHITIIESWKESSPVDKIEIKRISPQDITDAQAANAITELWHLEMEYITKPNSSHWEDLTEIWAVGVINGDIKVCINNYYKNMLFSDFRWRNFGCQHTNPAFLSQLTP